MASRTWLDLPLITTSLDDDIFCTIQGVGAGRDKQIKIQDIRTYMQIFNSGLTVASGDLEVSSGKVGIGVTPSTNIFEMYNSSAAQSAMNITNSTTGSGNNGFLIGIDGSANALISNLENTSMTFYTNSAPRMVIAADGKVNISSPLGVGITPASGLFEIYNSSAAQSSMTITNSLSGSGGNGLLIGIDSAANALISNLENTPMTFYTNSAPRMVITADGKISIGNETAPDCIAGGFTSKTSGVGLFFTHKSNITHGFSGIAESDTFLEIEQGVNGRTYFSTFSASGSESNTILFQSHAEIGSSTVAGFQINGYQRSGTGRTSLGATHRIVSFANGSTVAFYFTGDGTGYADNTWTTFSDERIKDKFKSLKYGLKEILELKTYCYNRLPAELKTPKDSKKSIREEIGLIAQEVFEIIPEICQKPANEEENLWGLDYARFSPILIRAIQELNEKIEALSSSKS